MKDWKPFFDECGDCGCMDIRVLTDHEAEHHAYKGDIAECIECGKIGTIDIDYTDDEYGQMFTYVNYYNQQPTN